MTTRAKQPAVTKRGRPAEFRNRSGVTVLLEAKEHALLKKRAQRAGTSVSAYARRLLVAALTKEEG